MREECEAVSQSRSRQRQYANAWLLLSLTRQHRHMHVLSKRHTAHAKSVALIHPVSESPVPNLEVIGSYSTFSRLRHQHGRAPLHASCTSQHYPKREALTVADSPLLTHTRHGRPRPANRAIPAQGRHWRLCKGYPYHRHRGSFHLDHSEHPYQAECRRVRRLHTHWRDDCCVWYVSSHLGGHGTGMRRTGRGGPGGAWTKPGRRPRLTQEITAAMGGAYEFSKCASANLREKDDTYNSFIGGALAGSMLGLRCTSYSAHITYTLYIR